jgi:hypothetical protein
MLKDYLPDGWRKMLGWLVMVAASSLIAAATHSAFCPPDPPMILDHGPAELAGLAGAPSSRSADDQNFGAIIDLPPDAPKFRPFSDTPAYRAWLFDDVATDPDDVFLWRAAKQVLGNHLPTRQQGKTGSCVAFAFTNAAEYLALVQITQGTAEVFAEQAQEAVYAIARVNIGKGRARGEDGSYGAWCAGAVTQYGVVFRARYGSLDLTRYDERECRRLGDAGLPADVIAIARGHPIKDAAKVRTSAEAIAALRSGYPIAIVSNVGFGPTWGNRRDKDGFRAAQGSWPHGMALIGYRASGRAGFYCMNSWGSDWISGPTGPGAPPPGGFWIEPATVDRMLRAGDSFALSGLAGFPARDLWLVRGPAARPRYYAGAARRALGALLRPGVSARVSVRI